MTRSLPLPWDLFPIPVETDRWPAIGKGRRPDRGIRALRDETFRIRPAHVREDPAGAHRIHPDVCPHRLERQDARDRVQSGFRQSVGGVSATHLSQVSHGAGDFHGAPVIVAPHKGEERLAHHQWTVYVLRDRPVDLLGVLIFHCLFPVEVGPRVVHEDVHPAGPLVHGLTYTANAPGVIHVQGVQANVYALFLQ